MENCATNLSIHQTMGTTQKERFLNALKTSYFLIDERKDIDYIEFSQKMSYFIKFFDAENIENGNWSTFFEWESTAILVTIFLWDIEKIQFDYKVLKDKIKKTKPTNNTLKEELIAFFEEIKNKIEKFKTKIKQLDEQILAKETLTRTSYLILDESDENKDGSKGILTEIIYQIIDTPIKLISSLINQYQFDKNIQNLIGLLSNWKFICGQSIENQLENYSGHSPHYSLFLSFLKLFGVAQNQLNEFTKRHLDFYYKDVLHVKPANAVPDYVNLILEPSENNGHFLPQNTIFPAGKNALGQNKFYASTSEISINAIKLKSFYSTYLNNSFLKKAQFDKINGTNKSFNVFTDNETLAETGILIASPLFYLSGGNRYILIGKNGKELTIEEFDFYITGEKGCIKINQTVSLKNSTSDNLNSNETRFANGSDTVENKNSVNENNYLFIAAQEKKIIGYNPEIHKEIQADTIYPVLKIVPKTYTSLQKLINFSENIIIDVKVKNFKNFVIANDTGTVDINKPFLPFGDFPKNGNGFVICSNEFFIKKNAVMKVTCGSLPNIKILKLKEGLWTNASPNENIKNRIKNTSPIFEFNNEDRIPDNESISGYFRFELDYKDFENGKFFNDFITAIRKEKDIKTPQAPIINSISIDYEVRYSTKNPDNPLELYHILPFGYDKIVLEVKDGEEVASKNQSQTINDYKEVLETNTNSGNIYLGFENANFGDSLNLLFQFSEGSSNPLKLPAKLKWSFLKGNSWESITDDKIGDETNGFIQSGLIHYTIPNYNSSITTVFPKGYFWIKIEVDEKDAICNFIGIHDHAFKAVLTDYEQNGSEFIEHIEKETITKLYEPQDFVKKISQPYASFGGKTKEDDTTLYQRTSERLRHKKRAITSWDYERLILDKFPEVFRIKCLNHYRYDKITTSKLSAGYVTLIPIAKLNTQERISWKPLVNQGTMDKIKEYISQIASPHSRIMVKQPVLEIIQLNFSVKYHDFPGADKRLYAVKLKNVINKYLSPWSFGANDVAFANTIEIATMIQLLDDQPFVDFISDFKVLQGSAGINAAAPTVVKEIIPKTDFTLFIAPDPNFNDDHIIKEITN